MMHETERPNIPRHVAIIMDGNGRWASARFLPRVAGHQAGMKSLERIIDHAKNVGVRYLSVYAFSTENWKRRYSEVQGLMGLFRYYLKGKISKMHAKGARLRFVGKIDAFPDDIRAIISGAEQKTADNTAIDVVICINYGGRQEILDAVRRMIDEAPCGEMTEEVFSSYLYAPDIPDPDLIIRTGGELRLSNFWLWQSSYSEYYFSDAYWPDFNEKEFDRALENFARRERRYGSA